MDTVTIARDDFEQMQRELKTLRNSSLYKRLLEFEQNIKIKKYTRDDVGF